MTTDLLYIREIHGFDLLKSRLSGIQNRFPIPVPIAVPVSIPVLDKIQDYIDFESRSYLEMFEEEIGNSQRFAESGDFHSHTCIPSATTPLIVGPILYHHNPTRS
jgi:hypothetical protein